jgi:hypothetical protein
MPSAADSRSWIDSVPGTGCPAHGGCRPPPWRAGSWVVGTAKGATAVIGAGQREFLERVMHQLQVPLREMEILGRGLQILVSEQNLTIWTPPFL